MSFKRGIHIEVDESLYKKIEDHVQEINRDREQSRMSMSRFVKTLVVDWAKGEKEHGEENREI